MGEINDKQDDFCWPELKPFGRQVLPKFNLDCLPDWAGDYAKAVSKFTETPPELIGGLVLAACSIACAKAFKVEPRLGYQETTNLWIFVGMPPGSRKSSVLHKAMEPLSNWEKRQKERLDKEVKKVGIKIKLHEARIKNLSDRIAKESDSEKIDVMMEQLFKLEEEKPKEISVPRLWTSDATPERIGTLLQEQNECLGWISSEGGLVDILSGRYTGGALNLDLLLKAHSGDSDRLDRSGRPSVFLNNPRLTIGLASQPEILKDLMANKVFRGRGLPARFLYLFPESNLGYRTLNQKEISQKVIDGYNSGLQSMIEWSEGIRGEAELKRVRFSGPAFRLYDEYSRRVEVMLRPNGKFEFFSDWAGKAPGALCRVAGVLHGIESIPKGHFDQEISEKTMLSAISLMEVFEEHMLFSFGQSSFKNSPQLAKKIIEWIKSESREFTARDVFNQFRGTLKDMNSCNEVLKTLENNGYIRMEKDKKTNAGRKSSPRIVLRPEILQF